MNAKTNILVADDDATVRRSYARSLSGTHCEVHEAFDGPQALQAMEHKHFDVVLLDLRMPGMDGIAVLATIKRRWPYSEVVVITGYPSIDSAKAALRLGAHDYLAKPVGPDEIIQAANGAARQKRWALRTEPTDQNDEASLARPIPAPLFPN